ncbi:MAG: aminoacyl-tRNA hydrolase [Oscillospiraceae bacterium]|nr:aminoacyl-tRNA hydrolase [Oscillospiraceae bacterium]
MYLIVGLGNPEPQYSNTKHNMGFDVINKISKKYDISVAKQKFQGLYGTGEIQNNKVILLKPQTYMNESGRSIVQAQNFFKVEIKDIIIIYDDVDISVGTIRIRENGSPNTHNGMKSVVQHLGTQEFSRIRVGIGQPNKDIADYVLEQISKKERVELDYGIDKAVEAVEEILANGVASSMNKYN